MADTALVPQRADLVDAVHQVLRQSAEPLTLPRIRERLPEAFHATRSEELCDVLQRQVAANVLVMCPKYRSGQDRYWDRPLREHARGLLRESLLAGPATWSELRKSLPKYLRHLADSVLNEELAKGNVHRHPPLTIRNGPRYALEPADIRTYVAKELAALLDRLQERGFARGETRMAIVQLLQEEEWADPPIVSSPCPAYGV
jgi:hypothetical protein